MIAKQTILSLLALTLGGILFARTAQATTAGSLDTSFTANVNGTVDAVAVQSDGKILVAGSFKTINGISQTNLARLNSDGSLDSGFAAVAPAEVTAVLSLPDGKILVGYYFTQTGSTGRSYLSRLNADGSIDGTFASAAVSTNYGGASRLELQSDGRILVLGYSYYYLGHGGPSNGGSTVGADFLDRFNADGSADATFKSPRGGPLGPFAVASQPDDRILYVSGSGTPLDPATIYRLNTDGSSNGSFAATGGNLYGGPFSLAVQPDGQIVIAGPAQTAGSSEVLRLNSADGSPDAGFQAATCTGNVDRIIRQPDGRLVLGGGFAQVNGQDRPHLARLGADGALDSGFLPPTEMDGEVQDMAIQPDGNLIISGTFTSIGGVTHQGIARIHGVAAAVPQVTSAASVTGQVGVPFSYQITADNGPTAFAASPVYSLNVGLGNPLPGGLSLDAGSGLISGTPTREGNYVIAVQTSNAAGADLVEITLTIATAAGQPHPGFFRGEEPLSNGVYYLKFFYSGTRPTNFFSYYSYLSDPNYLFHFDLGYEYVFDANDGAGGVYFYDFASKTFFYTSPRFPFPYLYDFSLNTTLYYYGDPKDLTRYNTGGVRYFYRFDTGAIFSK